MIGDQYTNRIDRHVFSLAATFLPMHTKESSKKLEDLIHSWQSPYLETTIADLNAALDIRPRDHVFLDQLQVFLLGYYYTFQNHYKRHRKFLYKRLLKTGAGEMSVS